LLSHALLIIKEEGGKKTRKSRRVTIRGIKLQQIQNEGFCNMGGKQQTPWRRWEKEKWFSMQVLPRPKRPPEP
jgi:hypothetical protein